MKLIKLLLAVTLPILVASVIQPALALDSDAVNVAVRKNNIPGSASAEIVWPDGRKKAANEIIDDNNDDDSFITVDGVPFEVVITLPQSFPVNAVRIFSGIIGYANNPSGELGLKSYRLEGFSNGKWAVIAEVHDAKGFAKSGASTADDFYYEHLFKPWPLEKIKLVILESGDTGKRMSSNEIISPERRTTYLREIEVFTKESGSIGKSLSKYIDVDFRLPAYVNRKFAELVFVANDSLKEAVALRVSFREKNSGKSPDTPFKFIVQPEPGKWQILRMPIKKWADGEYLATIYTEFDKSYDSNITRMLRKQTINAPQPPASPMNVAGREMLFFDDWYIQNSSGLVRRAIPAEQFPVTKELIGPKVEEQKGLGLQITSSGEFAVVGFKNETGDKDWKRFAAVSKDLVNWKQLDGWPELGYVSTPQLIFNEVTPRPIITECKPGSRYSFYDAKVDGKFLLKDVALQFSWYKPTKWGNIDIPAFAIYPVWEKTPGDFKLLMREPLTVSVDFRDGQFGEWKNSNDNFGGVWYGDGGKTLFFCQARAIPRFHPFRIMYDNIYKVNRILLIWRTQNGIDWTPTYFSMPTENDSIGYQHYGCITFPKENGDLRIAYLMAYDQVKQQRYTELNFSRDSILWKRFEGQPAFIANQLKGWNFGGTDINPVKPVRVGNYDYQVVNAARSAHFYDDATWFLKKPSDLTGSYLEKRFKSRNLESWPFFKDFGSWEKLANDIKSTVRETTGVVRYRADGWVCLENEPGKTGEFVTKTLKAGDTLRLNAVTQKGGSITVEVLDSAGKPILGYCGQDAAVFFGDRIDFPLTWSNGKITNLPKLPIKLRISITKSQIFALYW